MLKQGGYKCKLAVMKQKKQRFFSVLNLVSCIRDCYTDRFECSVGVGQGDDLSPKLFALFINNLDTDIKSLNRGVLINKN